MGISVEEAIHELRNRDIHFSLFCVCEKCRLRPKNGIKMRAATDRALPFYKSALCVNRKERRSLFPSFSGFARKATGIVVHVVHLRKYAGSCRSDGLRFRIPFEP